jgi:hypothetical protein
MADNVDVTLNAPYEGAQLICTGWRQGWRQIILQNRSRQSGAFGWIRAEA